MKKNYTTLTSFGVALARAAESYGVDSSELFRRADLDHEAMKNPNARYPDNRLNHLFDLALGATKDPAFGIAVGRFVAPTTLHALGFSLLASETLLAALWRLVRYYRIVSDAVVMELDKGQDDYSLVVDFAEPVPPVRVDALVVVLIDLCRRLVGEEFAPIKICLTDCEATSAQAALQAHCRAPVDTECEDIRLVFKKDCIETGLPTGNAELAYQNDKIVADYLARFDDERLSERVRAIFMDRMVTGKFSEGQIASQLDLSLRSLQRRLREERTSYQQLLDETRLDLALQYINRTELSVSQIAPLLGFSDSSNFNRAFKRWLGISPSKYRALGFV